MEGFRGANVDYVFQGEQRWFEEILDRPDTFDDATQTFDASVINEHLSSRSGFNVPFARYYSFSDVGAWRQACLRYDAFIGDRLHGGIAAMQAGVPALILHHDARVAELAEFFAFPSCSLVEFFVLGWQAAAERYLTDKAVADMKARYRQQLRKFVDRVHGCGLELVGSVARFGSG